MHTIPLDEALMKLGRTDPTFNDEIRRLFAPIKDHFLKSGSRKSSDRPDDGLFTPPPYFIDPELRQVAIQLAEFVLARGIDIDIAVEKDGSTLLHGCVLLRDPAIAVEAVTWCLAHGADANRRRDDGETPLSLALKFDRKEIADLMRA